VLILAEIQSNYPTSPRPSAVDELTTSLSIGTAATQPVTIPAAVNSSSICAPAADHGCFTQISAVASFLASLRSDNSFSIAKLRHTQRRLISPDTPMDTRPHGMDVQGMFRDHMFASGSEPLLPGESTLNISSFDSHHTDHCQTCHAFGSVQSECYYSRLRRCLTHGFAGFMKPDSNGQPVPVYDARGQYGNHASFDQYPEFHNQQLQRLLAGNKISPTLHPMCQNPLGVKIPHARWQQALTLTGIRITDDDTYHNAADKLSALSANNLKRRMVCDGTGCGVNDLFWPEPFLPRP
jgi:hypothetical protein